MLILLYSRLSFERTTWGAKLRSSEFSTQVSYILSGNLLVEMKLSQLSELFVFRSSEDLL